MQLPAHRRTACGSKVLRHYLCVVCCFCRPAKAANHAQKEEEYRCKRAIVRQRINSLNKKEQNNGCENTTSNLS
jgi:hypothetical protein